MWNVCEPFGLKWPLGALSLGVELQRRCLIDRNEGFKEEADNAKVYHFYPCARHAKESIIQCQNFYNYLYKY